MNNWFNEIARKISHALGTPLAFVLAALVVIIWVASGPFFDWSSGHSLIINTFTTIITYLMVFIIQNAQNRDTQAIQIKLDELIKTNQDARNELIDLEDKSDKEIQQAKTEIQQS